MVFLLEHEASDGTPRHCPEQNSPCLTAESLIVFHIHKIDMNRHQSYEFPRVQWFLSNIPSQNLDYCEILGENPCQNHTPIIKYQTRSEQNRAPDQEYQNLPPGRTRRTQLVWVWGLCHSHSGNLQPWYESHRVLECAQGYLLSWGDLKQGWAPWVAILSDNLTGASK